MTYRLNILCLLIFTKIISIATLATKPKTNTVTMMITNLLVSERVVGQELVQVAILRTAVIVGLILSIFNVEDCTVIFMLLFIIISFRISIIVVASAEMCLELLQHKTVIEDKKIHKRNFL